MNNNVLRPLTIGILCSVISYSQIYNEKDNNLNNYETNKLILGNGVVYIRNNKQNEWCYSPQCFTVY